MGDREVHTRIWWGEGVVREGDYLEDLGLHGRIILKLAFKEWDREALDLSGSG
jgi:hypothetical protein